MSAKKHIPNLESEVPIIGDMLHTLGHVWEVERENFLKTRGKHVGVLVLFVVEGSGSSVEHAAMPTRSLTAVVSNCDSVRGQLEDFGRILMEHLGEPEKEPGLDS